MPNFTSTFKLNGNVSIVCVLFFTTLPLAGVLAGVLAVLISVTTLLMTGTKLSSFSIFKLLLILMTIRTTFCYNLSMSMQMAADARVSLDRIPVFLEKKIPKMKITEHSERHGSKHIFAELAKPVNSIIIKSKYIQLLSSSVRE